LGQLNFLKNYKINEIGTEIDDRDQEELEQLILNSNSQEIPEKKQKTIRIATIDNYQGEESEIIILDLVRCNIDCKIGFMKDFQRMNVAISRARAAMIIIGSMDTFAVYEDWSKFFNMLKIDGCVFDYFPAFCEIHNTFSEIKCAEDFDRLSYYGGCSQICRLRLECGHLCMELCHIVNCNIFKCKQKCERVFQDCNSNPKHKCEGMCNQKCIKCPVKCNKTLKCGHNVEIKCFQNTQNYQCS